MLNLNNLGRDPRRDLLNNPIVVEKVRERAPGFYKAIVLDVLAVIAAAALGFLYHRYLEGHVNLVWVMLVLVAFTLISVFQTLLIKQFRRRVWVIVLTVIAMVATFVTLPINLLLGAAGLAIVFLLWGDWGARYEFRNNLEVRFITNARPLVSKVITAAILLAVLLYLPQVNEKSTFVSEDSFKSMFSTISGALNNFYPTIPFNSSVGDLVQGLAQDQLKNNPSYQNLSPIQKARALELAGSQVLSNLSIRVGAALEPKEDVSQALYRIIVGALNRWKQQFGTGFLIGWAILVFLIVRSVGFFFSWLITLIGFLIYQVLRAAGVIMVLGEGATHEEAYFS